jgi:ATP-dependent Zn protease
MLLEHRNSLMAIADALCENDELTGEQITRIVTAVLPA